MDMRREGLELHAAGRSNLTSHVSRLTSLVLYNTRMEFIWTKAALVVFGGWIVWLNVYALPVYFFFPPAFALNRLGQHYSIKPDDPAGWTTWVPGSWFWDFIYLNSNYHLEHHLFPSVPCYRLPELQRRLIAFHQKHGLKPQGYGALFRGYIIRNHKPHTAWV